MELSQEEKYEVERNRVVKILQSKEGPIELQELQEEYKNTFKSELGTWKTHFVMLEAFLKMGCGAEVKETRVALAKNASTPVASKSTSSQSMVRYLTRPQSPRSLDLATKEGKASLIVCGDLRSTAQSKKISTRTKLSRSKSASHFKAKRRPKSLGLAL